MEDCQRLTSAWEDDLLDLLASSNIEGVAGYNGPELQIGALNASLRSLLNAGVHCIARAILAEPEMTKCLSAVSTPSWVDDELCSTMLDYLAGRFEILGEQLSPRANRKAMETLLRRLIHEYNSCLLYTSPSPRD